MHSLVRALSSSLLAAAGALVLIGGSAARAAEQGVLLGSGDRVGAEITPGDEDAFDVVLVEGDSLTAAVRAVAGSTLVPRVRLFRPDGTELDVSARLRKTGTPSPVLRSVAVPAGLSGRWQVRIDGASGTTGRYQLAVRVDRPAPVVVERAVVAAGAQISVPFSATSGDVVRATVRPRHGGAPSTVRIDAPDGSVVPDSAGALRATGRDLVVRTPLAQGPGSYALVVAGAADRESRYDVTVRVRRPAHAPRAQTLPPEASVETVTPSDLRQEDAGIPVDLRGRGLLAGTEIRLEGSGVTVRGLDVLPDGSGRLHVDVAPDAPFGARNLVFLPPEMLGESFSLTDAVQVCAPVPTITSRRPGSVRQGESGVVVEIDGTGFRPGGRISIDGEGVTVGPTEVVSPTLARATISVDPHAPIQPRYITYTQPAEGGGASATSRGRMWIFHPDPALATVAPAVVRQDDTQRVLTFRGANFRAGAMAWVAGDGVAVTGVDVVSDDEARVTIDVAPGASFGVRDVTFKQFGDGGGASSTLTASLTIHAPDPAIASVTPPVASQLASDVELVVAGTGFRDGGRIDIAGAGLTLGTTTVVSPTEARVRVTVERDAAVGPRNVTFTQPAAGGGASATLAGAFDVHYPDPALTSVAPSSIRQEDAGLTLDLTGLHFRPGGTVSVAGGGVAVSSPTWISDTQFRVTLDAAPDATFGPRDVTYRQPLSGGGASASLASSFVVRAPDPTVSGVSIATLKQLETATVVVTGTGFRTGGTVTVSGTGLTLGPTTIVSATQATVQVTAAVDATVGPRSVTYTQPAAGGGASATLAPAFAVHYPDPGVTSISRTTLKQEESGVVVTLTGSHFRAGGTVAVSGTGVFATNATRLSDTSLQVTLAAAADAAYGARQVTYTQPSDGGGAAATLASALVVQAPDPAVSSATPAVVRQLDTITLIVDGSGFRAGGTISVSGSGLTLGTTTVESATRASVRVTAATDAPIGARDVTFTQPAAGGGASATLASAVRVHYPDPVVLSVSPAIVRQLDSVTLTVTGTNFRLGGTLTIPGAGLTVGATTVVSDTQATVQVSAAVDAAVGARDVTFTQPSNGGGAAHTLTAGLAVHYPDPGVTSISRTTLKQEESGVVVTLTGTHFRAGGTVSFSGAGLTVTSPTWISDTSFQFTVAAAADAPYGARSVTYTQPSNGGGASATIGGALTVTAPDPVLTSVSPTIVKQGATSLVLTLTGDKFRDNGVVHVSGSGITLANATRVSATQFQVQLTVDAFAPYGLRTIAYQQPAAGGGAMATLVSAFTVHAPDPTIVSVSPSVVKQEGTSLAVRLTGTGFRSDGAVALSGTGITVRSATWSSDSRIDLTLDVAAGATFGARDVTYTQSVAGGGAGVTAAAALTVHAPDPTVTAVSPVVLKQNDTSATLTVDGTGFRAGGTVSVSGTGLTLGATTIVSSTRATVAVTVASNATVGARSVTYTQPAAGGGATASMSGALAIHYPDPALSSASPSVLKQEQTGVVVTLTGNHFRSGGTVAVSGTGLTLTNATRVSDTSFQVTVAVASDATYGARSLTYTQPSDGGSAAVTLAAALDVRAPDPVVTSLSPSTIVQGTGPATYTLTGTGFRSGGAISVSGTGLTLGATTFVSATQATVSVTAAIDATMGLRDVTWTQPAAGGGAAGTGTGLLAVHAPTPTVTAISPNSAVQGDAAATFTLTGTNFRDGGAVSLGAGITATNATRLSDTSFQVTLAVASDATLGLRGVTYTQPTAGGGASATLVNGFQVNAPTPVVTSVSPAVVRQGTSGVTLTVTGNHFRTGGTLSVSGTGLTLGTTTVVSATQATVSVTTASNAAVGLRSVTFTQPAAGGSAAGTGTDVLSVHHPDPTVTSVTPTTVDQGSSGTFTLTGTNFRSGGTVTTTGTGVTLSSPTWVSDTSFTVAYTVAAGATVSSRDLTYAQPSNGGGATATKASAYQVTPTAPTLTSVTPSAFAPGATRAAVRVVGTNFNSGTTLSVSGAGFTVHSTSFVSSTTLDAVVSVAGDAPAGARDLTITPATGGGPARTFTGAVTVAAPAPVVASFSHATLGQGASSVSVTVLGQNFRSGDTLSASGTGVTFSGVTVVSASKITATVSVTGTATTGLRNLTVAHSSADGGQSDTLANAFRVVAGVPTVTAVNPGAIGVTGTGGATRDVPLRITGTNFMTGATVTVTRTGGTGISVVSGSASVLSDSQLDVTISLAGAATVGLWDVTVSNPGGLGGSGTTGAGLLDVKSSSTLAVNRVRASSGSAFGGERVTIEGSGFVDGCSVDFGTVRAAGTQVLDANTLVTTVPAPATSSSAGATVVNVKVTTPSATSATLTNGYSYAKDDVRFVVTSTVPAQGATAVARNLKSSVVVLSAPFNTATGTYGTTVGANSFWFESGGAFTAGGVRATGPGGRFLVLSRTTTGNLPIASAGVYVLDVPAALKSLGGNALVPTRLASTSTHDQYSFTLSTVTTDTTAPALATIVPANGATGVDPTTKVVLTFNEPLDPSTIALTTIAFTRGATTVPAAIALSDDLKTVTITPENELLASTTYSVAVGAGVADLCGNAFAATTYTFTTSNGTDTTAPTVDAVVVESLPSSVDGSGTYVGPTGTAGQAFDLYLPRDGWSIDVAFSDAGGAGIDASTFSAKCSVAVGSSAANAELAANFTVTSTGASWRIPSTAQVTAGDNVTFTFTVRDRSGNTSSSSTITVDVVDKDASAVGAGATTGGDHDPLDARRTWILRSDLDAYSATFASQTTPSPQQGATTTVASNNLTDLEEALRLVGLNSGSMTTESANTTNGLDTGTNAIVLRAYLVRTRELLNERFGIAADGTRGAGSADVEFLLPGEQGSLASMPSYSTANSSNSAKGFSEISIGGTLGADSSAYSTSGTIGQAWYDPRNRREEANLNTGGTTVTGIYLLGALKLQVNSNALFQTKVSQPFVSVHGGTPVGQHSLDDDVLAGAFDRTTSSDTAKNARYDAIMDAIEQVALYTSAVTAHEIGHSLGLVPDGGPKTGLFGAAHYGNSFTEATSATPNTSNHLDFLGNDLMSAATTYDSTTWTGSAFKRFSPLDLAYLLNRLVHDEGK